MSKKFYPPYHYFICTCDEDKEMSPKEAMDHLGEVHKMKKPFAGTRELVIHINGEPRHSATYKWEMVKGIVLYERYG